MERQITDLESQLLGKGFRLSHKTYKGKKSQNVEHYVYVGYIDNYKVMVYLTQKRNSISHYTIENSLPRELHKTDIDKVLGVYNEIYDMLFESDHNYDEEIVEIIESEQEYE